VTEGTAGSTGISLAMLAPAFGALEDAMLWSYEACAHAVQPAGCKCHVVMPDDAAEEKAVTIAALGASVQRVRPVSIAHPDHFVNVARRAAAAAVASGGPGAAYFADQFETEANFRAHAESTGPEVWAQTGGRLHAFVAAAGTGGTLAGVGAALRARDPAVRLYLVDPPGSSLYNRVTRGVLYARQEAEGRRTRHQVDTITEGIGINRLTANFMRAPRLDGAFRGSDAEAVAMARHLRAADGLFVGSSAAMNAVGALRVAQQLGPGHTVVTLLCDGGARHLSKFWSDDYLDAAGLLPPPEQAGRELLLLLSGALRPPET
jgi:cysteine synthase A